MIKRRKTRTVRVGPLKIGGGAPVCVQSMTKVPTSDVAATVRQIKRLEGAGCEIVRVAVKDFEEALAIRRIKSRIRIPLVADIHFNYRLALKAIEAGADKIRLNPGNISRREEIAAVVKLAKKRKVSIRIGVNSGSIGRNVRAQALSEGLVELALRHIKTYEELNFHDIVVSLKASDVVSTVRAYEELGRRCDYPFHLGITAAGPAYDGAIKSSVGIGALLLKGIGDTVRVSLTGAPEEEVMVARKILGALKLRSFGPEVISCPTCGRCSVDLVGLVEKFERRLGDLRIGDKSPSLRIAIMGCEVNGPGEARQADVGLACGKRSGSLFKKGEIVRKIKEGDFLKELLKEVERY